MTPSREPRAVDDAERVDRSARARLRWSASDAAVAIACAAIATLAGLSAMVASQDGSLHPSALVHIANQDPLASLARSTDPHFRFVTPYQHYDGAYYYAIARDPFLHGTAHTLIDQSAYRYGHPLHGWLAAALSLGQARQVPLALLLLSLIGLAIGGWAASRLAVHFGHTPWAGLVFAVSPGLLYAATVDTTETLGAALIALTFLAWVRGRFGLAVLLIVAVCLDKEQYITVPLGLAIWEIVDARKRRIRPEQPVVKALAIVTGPLVLAAWYLYVHARLHVWPFSYQPGNFGKPFAGWVQTFRLLHALSGGSFDQAQIGGSTPPVLVATAALLILAAIVALRMRSVFDATLLGMVVITSMQGWRTLVYPHELFRTPSTAVLLALAVLLLRPRPGQAAAPPPTTAAEVARG